MVYHSCVYSEQTYGDGQRNCPENVEFYSKNKFEKLVHLVGFIVRKYGLCETSEVHISLLTACEKNQDGVPS